MKDTKGNTPAEDTGSGGGRLLRTGVQRRDFFRLAGGTAAGIAVFGGLSTLLEACSSTTSSKSGTSSSSTGATPKTVEVGGIFSLTGPTSFYGQGAHDALVTVVDTINASGGIKSLGGAKIHMTTYNSQGSSTTAESLAEQAFSGGAVAVVGCGDGTSSLGVARAAGRLNKIFVSGDPGANLSKQGSGVYTVSPQISTYTQLGIDAVVNFAKQSNKQVKTAAITYLDIVDFATAVPPATQYLKSKGITTVASVSYPVTQSTYGSIVSQLKNANADLYLQFGIVPDVEAIVKEMAVLGYNPEAVLGIIGAYATNTLGSGLKTLATGIFGVAQFLSTVNVKAVQDVVKDWDKAVPSRSIGPFTGECVTAYAVLFNALERAGSTDTAKLMQALGSTDLKFGTPFIVIPGGVKFDSQRHNTAGSGVVFQFQSGKSVPVYPSSAAGSNKPVFPKPAFTS